MLLIIAIWTVLPKLLLIIFMGQRYLFFQHWEESQIDSREEFCVRDSSGRGKQRPKLPSVYIIIKPTKEKIVLSLYSEISISVDASEWLTELNKTEIPVSEWLSFSGFYSKQGKEGNIQSINQLLPFHQESVNTSAMVRHCMDLIQQLTEELNPGQNLVITADQPVYALVKQVQ